MQTNTKPNPRVAQLWYSIHTLSVMLELSESTLRRRIQEGKFGRGAEFVVNLDGDIRVSTLGYYQYIGANPYHYDDTVKARNQAEMRRKLAGLSARTDEEVMA